MYVARLTSMTDEIEGPVPMTPASCFNRVPSTPTGMRPSYPIGTVFEEAAIIEEAYFVFLEFHSICSLFVCNESVACQVIVKSNSTQTTTKKRTAEGTVETVTIHKGESFKTIKKTN